MLQSFATDRVSEGQNKIKKINNNKNKIKQKANKQNRSRVELPIQNFIFCVQKQYTYINI